MLIDSLLSRYQEQRVRLRDIHSDEEDGGIDDAVEVGAGGSGGYGLMSRTETHYVFGGQTRPEGFVLGAGQDDEPPTEDDDRGLGLGAGDASILDTSLLAGLDDRGGRASPVVPQPRDPPADGTEEAVSPPRGARPKVTLSSSETQATNARRSRSQGTGQLQSRRPRKESRPKVGGVLGLSRPTVRTGPPLPLW